jgi:microcystin-dependent protein
MTVESATYISGLNASYPPGSDTISEGDDHLRLIKSVLKSTLPNADEAINGIHTGTTAPTPTSAGQLWFDTSGTGELKVRDKSDSAFAAVDTSATTVPAGIITMWSGAVSAVPSGWVICDGNNSTPNLTGKFIIHADADAGGTYDVGDAAALGATGAHTLTTAEMPSHNHSYYQRGYSGAAPASGSHDFSDDTVLYSGGTGSTGGGGTHTHTGSLPPYYALAYIMKT